MLAEGGYTLGLNPDPLKLATDELGAGMEKLLLSGGDEVSAVTFSLATEALFTWAEGAEEDDSRDKSFT